MEENNNKIIFVSLAAMLIGSLLFIFALSINYSIIPLIANYIMSLLLLLSSLTALYKKYRNEKKAIIVYLLLLNSFLVILFTYAFITRL